MAADSPEKAEAEEKHEAKGKFVAPEKINPKKKTEADEAKKASIPDLYQKFSSSEKGLSSAEAKDRIQKYGYNELPEKKENPLLKFLKYFNGPIAWMIEAAIIISAVLGRIEDVVIISILLAINAIVGFWQENQASNAIESLRKRLAPNAKVLRDGRWTELKSRELVPGDIVRIRIGDIVPADGKLINGDYLSADESALTGESLPVDKHLGDVAYSGSIVRKGEMDALVVATGTNTFFGRTAQLAEEAVTVTHFQKAVLKIGDYLIALAIALVAVVFVVSLFRHESILDVLQFSLVLIVAAIPAALPAVLSITMAVGAIALAKKEAIVSRLVAIEEMSGVDILCADKTGTITENSLTLSEIQPFGDFKKEDVLQSAILASREEDRDPIDMAIIQSKQAASVTDKVVVYHVTKFKPFDPVIKRTEATVVDADGKSYTVSKGAPQVILKLTGSKEELGKKVDNLSDEFARKGYRTLGVARTDDSGRCSYLGLLALYDPPRDDSAETIKTAESMGLEIKMVTGDHLAIAREIAREVHLGTNIITAETFAKESDSDATNTIEQADGFAQVFP
ncbi:MAG TPA: plasma-membrane proton-efflux P-type ATPase, partial [Methanomicrobiales archaeon]|nr:plasma-membrane proton-efflux P-type ATPase [Methanomicrobiales archaeon]